MKRFILSVSFGLVMLLGMPKFGTADGSCDSVSDGWNCNPSIGAQCVVDDCYDICDACCEENYGLVGIEGSVYCDDVGELGFGNCYCDCICVI